MNNKILIEEMENKKNEIKNYELNFEQMKLETGK